MKVAVVGASALGVATARSLIAHGHEVVLVDLDRDRLEELVDELDCGFVHGDGTRPAILHEADPAGTGLLYCLTDNDQSNILAALVGRSLGFGRVVARVESPDFEHLCMELGLGDVVVPDRYVADVLAGMVEGEQSNQLSGYLRGPARLFGFVAAADEAGPVADLKPPAGARLACVYRAGDMLAPGDDAVLAVGDEVVLLAHERTFETLTQRWSVARRPRGATGRDEPAPVRAPGGAS